ncbi:MAG: omptin family outer membrane protease [Campylobacterota bacterium]|nr:omptin family outer membrane protease [Campylobacterota bacterium]
MKKSILLICSTVLVLSASDVVMALYPAPYSVQNIRDEAKVATAYEEYKNSKLSIRTSVGLQKGSSKEIVYNTDGTTLSELTWETNSLYVANIGLTYKPLEWLAFNFDYKLKVIDGSAVMDDYDWSNGASLPWSDWSHHDDTEVTNFNAIDVSMDMRFFSSSYLDLLAIVGYKMDNTKWIASGGTYEYNSGADIGTFANGQQVISYEQDYKTPYIGVKLNSEYKNITCSARFIGSNMVEATSKDIHFLRNLQFDESYSGGKMMNFNIALGYRLSNFTFNIAYEMNNYYLMKGDTDITDLSTGETSKEPNSGGLSSESSVYSVGASYAF